LNSRRKQHSPDIPINIFLDYFKNLNQNDIERLNIVLNSSITADEIQKSLKKLKNNKSSGEDTIINEYLKYPGYVVFCDCSKFSNIP
jgi:hypothetical protein